MRLSVGMIKKIIILALLIAALGWGISELLKLQEEVVDTDVVVDIEESEEPELDVVEQPKDAGPPTQAPNRNNESETPDVASGPEDQINGKVFDDEVTPLAGATIVLFQYRSNPIPKEGLLLNDFSETEIARTTSDKDGVFQFKNLAEFVPRSMTLRVMAKGYITQLKDAVGPGTAVNAHMIRGEVFGGKVLDFETGKGIGDCFVQAVFKKSAKTLHRHMRWDQRTRTKSDGSFEFMGAPVGKLIFHLRHPDYGRIYYDYNAQTKIDRRPEIVAGGKNQFEFRIERGSVLNAVIVAKSTGQPIKGALVTLYDFILPSQRKRTGVFGKFKMKGLRPGSQQVEIRADGFTLKRERIEVNRKNLSKEIRIELQDAGRASGLVIDHAGDPVVGAKIFVAEAGAIFRKVRGHAETMTDQNGQFSVSNLNGGAEYMVAAVSEDKLLGVCQVFKAINGEFVDNLIVKMGGGAVVEGQVTDDQSVALRDVTITLQIPPYAEVWFPPGSVEGQAQTLVATTDATGSFKFPGLYAGRYFLTADSEAFVPMVPKELRIMQETDRINETIELRLGRKIRGTVRDIYGAPVAGVEVAASPEKAANRRFTAKTDEQGRFEINRLQKAIYVLQAESNDGVSKPKSGIETGAQDVQLVFEKYGSLSSRVLSRRTGEYVEVFDIRLSPMDVVDKSDGARRELTSRHAIKMMRQARAFRKDRIVSDNGEFKLKKIHPGTYLMEILTEDFRVYSKVGLIIKPDEDAAIAAILLEEGARLQGEFRDTSGNPIDGSKVAIRISAVPGAVTRTEVGPDGKKRLARGPSSWEGKDVKVDSSGRYSVGGLPPGRVRIQVASKVYCVPTFIDESFGAESVNTKDFVLTLGGSMTLKVLDDFKEPIPSAMARLFDMEGRNAKVDGRGVMGRADASGKLSIPKLEPGSYRVQLQRYGHELTEFEMSVAEGENFIKEVTLVRIK